MKTIIKARWAIFMLWLVAAVILAAFQPNINKILQQRGQSAVNADSPSAQADALLQKMNLSTGTESIIAFYDENKITDDEMNQIQSAVTELAQSSSELGISDIIDPFSVPDAKNSLVSEDGTTLLVSFKLDKGTRDINDIKDEFESKLVNVNAEHYLTGSDFISNDYLNASMAGIEKSAILTVLFILIILIIMFRSVITPVVSLLAVAFSYLTSMGISAQLIDKANFPVTNLTQMLLILILFGIGTDYNILLFSRFKKELISSNDVSVDEAIVNTYKTAGKTIAFSVLTVLFAFLSLIFSKSPIYKSGIVVVIGAAMLLLEIMTLTPFAMKLLGKKLFWPSKSVNGHKESKLWGTIAASSTKRPVVSVLVIVLIIGAAVFFYQQKLNFNMIGELGDAYPSSKGFNIVAEHFGKGQAMPSTLVIEGSGTLDNNDSMAVIDSLTESIKKIDGVKQVTSVTQPQGNPIDEFYISGQMSSVTGGLKTMQDGLNQISNGMSSAQDSLGSADFSKVTEMVSGTAQLHDAVSALAGGLSQLQAGISDDSANSQTISSGIASIESSLTQVSSGITALSQSYQTIQTGLTQMGTQYQAAANALLSIKATLSQMQTMVTVLGGSYSGSNSDVNYVTLKTSLDKLVASLSSTTPEGIAILNLNYNNTISGFGEANKNLEVMSNGISQMSSGLKNIESGLGKTSAGIGTVVTNMKSVSEGLAQMESGQKQVVSGLGQFGSFGSSLAAVSSALNNISSGLGQTNTFLNQYGTEKTFHIPDEALTATDYQTALNAYMSKDRTITKLTIILKYDPYSRDAEKTVQAINDTVSSRLKGTVLSDAQFGISGQSAVTNDTDNILSSDLNRMIIIVLVGVFLVLLFVIRSVWLPAIITASLVGTYYAAMLVTNTIFIDLLHYPGLSSFVPFFSFIIIVALGVDYSIFLMMGFREYKQLPPSDAIVMASKQIGSVVIAAVIILGGTFATLIPSGMLLLIEIAVPVIVGLFVLCFIMLPVFLPAMIRIISKK